MNHAVTESMHILCAPVNTFVANETYRGFKESMSCSYHDKVNKMGVVPARRDKQIGLNR